MDNLYDLGAIAARIASELPNELKSKQYLLQWLDTSPYSPYVTLFGGKKAKFFQDDESYVSQLDQRERFVINDSFVLKLEKFKNFAGKILSAKGKLPDVVTCSEVLKNYPLFKDTTVSLHIGRDDKGRKCGSYNFKKNHIEVFADSTLGAMSVLIHEMQHAIQHVEGFDYGKSYYNDQDSVDMFISAKRAGERIYYHGSNAMFDKFEKSGDKIASLGVGYYFTPNLEKAESYGKHIYECKIDTYNFLDWNNLGDSDLHLIKSKILSLVPPREIAGYGTAQKRYESDFESRNDFLDFFDLKIDETSTLYHDRAKAVMNKDENGVYVQWMEQGLDGASPQDLLYLCQRFIPEIAKELGKNGAIYGDEVSVYDNSLISIEKIYDSHSQAKQESGIIEIADGDLAQDTRADLLYETTLGEIYKDDSLYIYYPELQTMPIHFIDSPSYYDPSIKTIFIQASNSKDSVLRSLVHETQHAIQHIENWGGGADYFAIKEKAKKADLYLTQAIIAGAIEDSEDAPIRLLKHLQLNPLNAMAMSDYDELAEGLLALSEGSLGLYRRYSGEQMSRAVEYRLSMTQKERDAESWIETLVRVEGAIEEPIIRVSDGVSRMFAYELEKRYLDENGKLDERLIAADGVKRLPSYFTTIRQFAMSLGEKQNSRFANIQTPVGNVRVHIRSCFEHFTKNSNNVSRIKINGGFLDAFKDPLFIVRDIYEGKDALVFYKPMESRKEKGKLVHIAGYAVDSDGIIQNSTYFGITKARLERYIKTTNENLIYFKLAGADTRTDCISLGDEMDTQALKEIVSSKSNNYNKHQDALRRKIGQALSIVPNGMHKNDIKCFLYYVGFDDVQIDKFGFDLMFKENRFDSSLLEINTTPTNIDYLESIGEIEAREVEDEYITRYRHLT